MDYSVQYITSAQEDLREIALYIQTYNPDKAEPFVNSIIDYFSETLGEFPNSGKVYIKDIRKLTYNKYTAFYRVNKSLKSVEMIHVVDLTKPLEAREIDF